MDAALHTNRPAGKAYLNFRPDMPTYYLVSSWHLPFGASSMWVSNASTEYRTRPAGFASLARTCFAIIIIIA